MWHGKEAKGALKTAITLGYTDNLKVPQGLK
jgi:hypothetical protein